MSEQAAFTGKTHIGVVLDKSGSMGSVRQETIDGFNRWLEGQKQQPGEAALTLCLFDTAFAIPVRGVELAKVNPLDDTRYKPSGSTALYDAMAHTISEVEKGVGEGDRVLLLVATDGQENSSREFSKEKILALIQAKEAAGNWTVVYLSAAPDAFTDASVIGVASANTQAFTPDALGTKAAWDSVGTRSASYRSSANLMSANFFGGEQHAEQQPRQRPAAIIPPSVPRPTPGATAWHQVDPGPPTNSGESAWTSS